MAAAYRLHPPTLSSSTPCGQVLADARCGRGDVLFSDSLSSPEEIYASPKQQDFVREMEATAATPIHNPKYQPFNRSNSQLTYFCNLFLESNGLDYCCTMVGI